MATQKNARRFLRFRAKRQVVVALGFGGIYRMRTIGCCNEVTLEKSARNQHRGWAFSYQVKQWWSRP